MCDEICNLRQFGALRPAPNLYCVRCRRRNTCNSVHGCVQAVSKAQCGSCTQPFTGRVDGPCIRSHLFTARFRRHYRRPLHTVCDEICNYRQFSTIRPSPNLYSVQRRRRNTCNSVHGHVQAVSKAQYGPCTQPFTGRVDGLCIRPCIHTARVNVHLCLQHVFAVITGV